MHVVYAHCCGLDVHKKKHHRLFAPLGSQRQGAAKRFADSGR